MIRNNWHTHTSRCGHAKGSDEEYVLSAIKAGIKRLGFSDHAPYPNVYNDGFRMYYEDLPGYIESIRQLKEKYKNQIEVYLGLEIDYCEEHIDTLIQYRKEFDYLIIGQHGVKLDDDSSYLIKDKEGLKKYCDIIERACEKGLVDCIAHPDVCMWSYPKIDEHAIDAARRIADIAHKYKVPVEANCGSGVFRGAKKYEDCIRYAYPTEAFFKEFAKKDNEVIIGLDIHDPQLFGTDEYINRAMSVIERSKCKIISDYDMIENARKRKEEYGYRLI